jgi:O-antigen/teichoic acid export membrane protein
MTIYDLGTWAAVVVLIVGAAVVFGFFLRDARRILREMGAPDDRQS